MSAFCSQEGNILFLVWEHFSPNVGMFLSQRGNNSEI